MSADQVVAGLGQRPDAEKKAMPAIAYVTLWFPLSSETFVFTEIVALQKLGLPVEVFTLYGKSLRGCSPEMRDFAPVSRMGIRALPDIIGAAFRVFRSRPGLFWRLFRQCCARRMRDLEALAENTWSFFAGFLLAEKCRESNVALIHAPWANGPATAAWVASSLTGIPFAFTGRAGDIYPEDGLLAEKIAAASFVRTNNAANLGWLSRFLPDENRPEPASDSGEKKLHLVYNNLTFSSLEDAEVAMQPPYRLLAIGRFVAKKGFSDLLTAVARLRREGIPVCLTLVGDGFLRHSLRTMRKALCLENCVEMPGFLPHDVLRKHLLQSDILVVPSVVSKSGNRDGIPNVIMEALSHRLPVIATDVCGISEVVRNGQTGLLVPPNDPAALANAIRAMLADPEMARQMANSGRGLVAEMFDSERNTRALLDLYREASGRPVPGQDSGGQDDWPVEDQLQARHCRPCKKDGALGDG